MAAQHKTGRRAREDRERKLLLKHRYENRITVTRYAKQNLDNGDYSNAVRRFVEYLQTISEIKKAKDIYALKPDHFNPKKDLTEMMMISHIYFEMARVYDAAPRFADECKKCLDQFVLFSANQPYQIVNSEMIRKHLKKSVFKNPMEFRAAYQQIYIQSKKCFVVTYCYGTNHPITADYRCFKDWLLNYRTGQEIVRLYYLYSSVAVPRWESKPLMHLLAKVIIRPALVLFSKTVLPLILK